MALAQPRRVADGLGHVVLGQLNRLVERMADGELGGQRCGEGAAGTVRVLSVHAWSGVEVGVAIVVEYVVRVGWGRKRIHRRAVAALDEHRLGARGNDGLRRPLAERVGILALLRQAAAAGTPFGVVLLDLLMPGMDELRRLLPPEWLAPEAEEGLRL